MLSTNSSLLIFLIFQLLTILNPSSSSSSSPKPKTPLLFREYIGAEFTGVKFSDVPINPKLEFHFILSFAIDSTPDGNSSTNGLFRVFWDSRNLSAHHVKHVKRSHRNVKVALSLGGDTVNGQFAYFSPECVDSWVANAVPSLTRIIKDYDLDGIDVDYEHFRADPHTFAECIGRLLKALKRRKVISFASIAPYDYPDVQSHYIELWKKYGEWSDYVNFQFYPYPANTTISQFLRHFELQSGNYEGGKVLVSFTTGAGGGGGLSPANGLFPAFKCVREEGKLHGSFVWSGDDSAKNGFMYEEFFQSFLTGYF